MSNNRVFRKVSLDRLSSPEQLDQVMSVTQPRGWIALAAVSALLLTALTWSVFGSLADKVAGRGILVKSGGILEVVATAGGRVSDVAVTVGDSVTQGQVIAWVEQPDLVERLQHTRDARDAARREYDQAVRFAGAESSLEGETAARRGAALRETVEASRQTLRGLGERIAAQEELVKQGLITRPTLLATRQQYDGVNEKMRAAGAELAQLEAQAASTRHARDERLRGIGRRLEEAQAQVAQMERDLNRASQVVSPYTGRILEVMAEQGRMVGPGEPVLTLDLTGSSVQDLLAVVYVPSVYGKMVKPGMEIQVAPSTVRAEEYGMMLGRVTFVSSYPSTPRGMVRVLKNDQLVNELSGGGAPYEVHAELIVDPATASQYRWSSSGGPPMRIQSGTTAMATVTVASQRPLAKVIPLLRKWSGT